MTEELSLRPVAEDDLTVLEALTQDPETAGEFARFGWFDPGRWRRRWAENGLLGQDGGALMVVRGGEQLGFVTWNRRQTTPASYCWSMGIAMLPRARGHGYGTEAHRLLTRYLFAHTTVHRIEADTEVENVAERRALEKAGVRQEGVLRGCAWRDGAWRDGVVYGLLRTDTPA
ncbi:GNAT family protein [Streptomyces sp. B6B3]|uniref:GNAT family N-acetyltransferase n=1 Tax=Streptomyces sp. B6B3 TaxID=3153570 RepID=UPI00325DC9F8